MTRQEFDALLTAALSAGVPPANPDDPASLAEQQDAIQEAQLLDAEARSFADAVDRDGKGVPYGSAVVLEGSNGVAVVDAGTYAATPMYWHTVVGRVDRLTQGPQLLQVLQQAANRGGPRVTQAP